MMGNGFPSFFTHWILNKPIGEPFCLMPNFLKGFSELLEEIRLLEIPIAIVTDMTAQIQFRKILYFNLDYYFDHVVTSEEAGCEKTP